MDGDERGYTVNKITIAGVEELLVIFVRTGPMLFSYKAKVKYRSWINTLNTDGMRISHYLQE